jgi:hypothetical protein
MATEPSINPQLLFPNVEEALAPLSAGTETKICVVSNCDSTMTTLLDVPHPTYLNEYGKAIVQLNYVELGGMNGLNS